MSQQGQIELTEAASRVRARLNRVNFLRWMEKSWWIAGLTAVAGVMVARFAWGWREDSFWIAVGVLALWLLAGVVRTVIQLPSEMGALSIWDERGGWKDLFSSALFFSKKEQVAAGEAWHVGRALKRLPEASQSIAKDFPLPQVIWAVAMILMVLAFAKAPILLPTLEEGDTLLTDEMLAEAERQANELEREKEDVESLEGLKKEEREELEKIRDSVDGAMDELADSDGKTTREVLSALEARARAAERLAEKLGAASDEWASAEFLREMSQHPDSADLAAAIKDKDADQAALESDNLAEMLDNPDLKLETRDRVTTALSQTIEKATDDDRKKPVGERVGNASRKMEAKQPRTAASEFSELAKHFRVVKKREEAEEKLQKLADKLREAGSSISGSKLEKMQQLAKSQSGKSMPKGTQPLSQNPLGSQAQMPGGQSGQKGNPGQMPIPGPQNPDGQGQQQGQGGVAMPVPGTGQKGQSMSLSSGKGGQKGGQKGSGLFAPIPGQSPGGSGAPGASLGGGGAAAGMNGGLQAGTGTAGLSNDTTEAMKASQDAKITAQINEDGESTFRPVQGQARREQARLERQQLIVETIRGEEEALDTKALPMSRRQHVTRYLETLRERFEEGGGGDE